jgi:hypothetical protein
MPRPEPIRCGLMYGGRPCGGFIYAPRVGEVAEVVRVVRHHERAAIGNHVCGCTGCRRLYEIRITSTPTLEDVA